jgi:hypothetical protein
MASYKIKKITQEEAHTLLSSEPPHYQPLGLFYIAQADGSFTGIDNQDGNAWTEDFKTKSKCLYWLKR